MKFFYQARTKEGELRVGEIEAISKDKAIAILHKYGLVVTYISESKKSIFEKKITILGGITKGDIATFTRQLAIMLRSDIPVVKSLQALARQIKKKALKQKILKISEEVEGGATLSRAFSLFPEIFPPFYIGMIRSGEITGRIPESLDYLAGYLEREREFSSRVIGVLVYPAFILSVFFIVMMVMGFYVIPKFAEVFAESEIELPRITQILISFTVFLRNYWYLFFLFFVGIIVFIYLFVKSEEGRRIINNLSLSTPLVKDFVKKIYLTRIALTLSTLIAGGLPISQAIEVTANMVANHRYKEALLELRDEVKAGKRISSVLISFPELFPPLFVQMVNIGEQTGKIESTLQHIFEFYEKEVDRIVRLLPVLLEPTIILILGVLVLILALSLFLPLAQRGFMFQ